MLHLLELAAAAAGSVLFLVVTARVAWAVWRGAGGTALDTLGRANRVLERRVLDLEKQGLHDQTMIAALVAKTDVSVAIAPLVVWSTAHEERAAQRHEATLAVLGLIADRLGPDREAQAA